MILPLAAMADSFPTQTSPISATALPLPAGASIAGSVAVTGPLTDAQLRAAAVPISGTVTANVGSSAQLPVALDGSGYLKVHEQGTVPVTGTFFQAAQPVTDNGGSLTIDGTVGVSGSVAVTGTFYQATQPISGTVTANAGTGTLATSSAQLPAALDGSGYLKTHEQGTVPVTGTFWQATQPVSGTVSINAIPAGSSTIGKVDQGVPGASAWKVDGSAVTQPVSGTFYQATQPVSGTFWQATQPVSGTVTANAGSGTMAVSGTFWQATQPVSGTVTANAGSGTMAVSGTFWQATQPVSGTFFQATQPVSAASLPLPTGAAIETGGNLATLVTQGAQGQETVTLRGDALLPATTITLQRMKLATGEYGVDLGDVGNDNPLPVESRTQRQFAEQSFMNDIDTSRFNLSTRGPQRMGPVFLNRGGR